MSPKNSMVGVDVFPIEMVPFLGDEFVHFQGGVLLERFSLGREKAFSPSAYGIHSVKIMAGQPGPPPNATYPPPEIAGLIFRAY